MYRQDKDHQLENRSHVRGLLSKELYGFEETERQRKRRLLKEDLDRQVQQRKRVKQHQQEQMQRKLRKEEDDIKRYLHNVAAREKPLSTLPRNITSSEQVNFVSLRKDNPSLDKQAFQGRARKEMQSDRRSVHYENIPEQIPVMGDVDTEQGTYAPPQQEQIPVMEEKEETRKRRKTKGAKQGRRKQTHSRLDTLGSHKNTESGLKELEMQLQNRRLKEQVRKSEQAIRLMMNAIRTNPKLEKVRDQVEKILQSDENTSIPERDNQRQGRQSEGNRFFPTLSFKSEKSIMKDYIFGAAKMVRRTANAGSSMNLVPLNQLPASF